MKLAAATLMLFLAMPGVNAQPVYRCGSVYSQTPCPNGKVVEATDPRTAAQRVEARRVVADERRLAAELRRERLAEQAALKPATASSLGGSAPEPAKPASAVPRGHSKKKRVSSKQPPTSGFITVDPSSLPRRGQKPG